MNKISVVLILTLLTGIMYADVILQHNAPAGIKKGREINLSVDVQLGFSDIEDMTVFYRPTGDITYITELMVNAGESDPVFRVQLPDNIDKGNGIEYYFEARLMNNTVKTLPEIQPNINPYRLHKTEKSVTPSSNFVRLSPEYNTIEADDALVIAISTYSIENQVQEGSVKIMYDNKDMTKKAYVSPNMVVLTIDKPSAGTHSFQVTAELKNGKKILSRKWIVSVKSNYDFKMPYNISGNIRFRSNAFSRSADNSDLESSKKSANVSTHIQSYYKKTMFYTDLTFSSKESSTKQAVNRYTLGLNVPHFELKFGDHSPSYSNFILSSTNVRGFHSKFFTRKFRMLFNYGKSQRAIDSEVTVVGDSSYVTRTGAFDRNTLGARVEIGDYDGFFWGFSFVKNKDDVESLDKNNYLNIENIEGDNTVENRVFTPKDNFVVGGDLHMNLWHKRIKLGTEIAISLYNNDIIDGVMDKDELEEKYNFDAPIDPEDWENIITINPNLEPLKPGDANIALRGYANIFIARNQFMLSYSEVGSSFKSLSAGSLQQDFRTISISDNVSLLENQIFFNGGVNISSDNLEKQRSHTNTSTSIFSTMNLRFRNMPTLSVSYNTTGTSSSLEEALGDSVDAVGAAAYNPEIDMDFSTISTRIAYNVKQINAAPTTFSIGYSMTNSVDNQNSYFDNSSNSISFGANSVFRDFPLITTFKYTFYEADEELLSIADTSGTTFEKTSRNYNSLYTKLAYDIMQHKVKPYASIKYTKHGGDEDSQSLIYFNTGVLYHPFKPLTMSTSIGLNNYTNDDTEEADYSSFNWRFNLTYNF